MSPDVYIKSRSAIDEFGCWLWRGHIAMNGYALAKLNKVRMPAHRFSYKTYRGDIPEKYQVDHTCHTAKCKKTSDCQHRRCVNPDHLEAVTPKENIARSNHTSKVLAARTHCNKGHSFDVKNTYFARRDGVVVGRVCRACHRQHAANYARRLK